MHFYHTFEQLFILLLEAHFAHLPVKIVAVSPRDRF